MRPSIGVEVGLGAGGAPLAADGGGRQRRLGPPRRISRDNLSPRAAAGSPEAALPSACLLALLSVIPSLNRGIFIFTLACHPGTM